MFMFPADLDEPDYQHRWQVWEINSAGERAEMSISPCFMCVRDGVVWNPFWPGGGQVYIDGWHIPFNSEIEMSIDSGPSVRVRHGWGSPPVNADRS
jgi:hypothetical protein